MTEPITSHGNPRLKEVRKLHDRKHRERTGLFLAEGEDMLAAALNHGHVPGTVYFDPESADLLPPLPAEVEQVPVDHAALASAGSLGSGSRVIGVWDQEWAELPGPARGLGDERPLLYLHDVADPGNVGAILRAAHAFGAGPVALSPQTADPFGPKAVRGSMGAIFAQPVTRATWEQARRVSGNAVALVPGAGRPLRELEWSTPLMFVLGAERTGLPAGIVAACDQTAHVALSHGADSLNVAMTATLCLYEYRARTDA